MIIKFFTEITVLIIDLDHFSKTCSVNGIVKLVLRYHYFYHPKCDLLRQVVSLKRLFNIVNEDK